MTRHKAHKKPAEAQTAPQPALTPEAVETPAPEQGEPSVQAETTSAVGGALVEPDVETIRRLSAELEQLKDRHLRLAAEFDNFRKRTQRERAEAGTRAQADLVAGILDSLDDLGRVAHFDPQVATARDVLAGVELVERKVARVLGLAGLERVGTEGEPFDPNVHEAVSTAPAPTVQQDHVISSVLQPGYKFGGALLRPARVSVYLWHEPAPTDNPQPGQ